MLGARRALGHQQELLAHPVKDGDVGGRQLGDEEAVAAALLQEARAGESGEASRTGVALRPEALGHVLGGDPRAGLEPPVAKPPLQLGQGLAERFPLFCRHARLPAAAKRPVSQRAATPRWQGPYIQFVRLLYPRRWHTDDIGRIYVDARQ